MRISTVEELVCLQYVCVQQTRPHLTSAGFGFANPQWLCALQEHIGLDMVKTALAQRLFCHHRQLSETCCPWDIRLPARCPALQGKCLPVPHLAWAGRAGDWTSSSTCQSGLLVQRKDK